MYNQIASQYTVADRFGSITQSHAAAIQQIAAAKLGSFLHYKVLDLGVGDAGFIKKVAEHFDDAVYTGIDLSSEMLAQAKQHMPELICIEGKIEEVDHLLPFHSQDLVLAHFINAYIPVDVLFERAAQMLRSNGYFSLITTTYDSFPVAQQYLAEFIAHQSLLGGVVGHYYKSLVKQTTVAVNLQALLGAFEAHQFEVMTHQRLTLPIALKDAQELENFGIAGTWWLNVLNVHLLPQKLMLKSLRHVWEKIFTFPYEDTHVIDVVLAKKG